MNEIAVRAVLARAPALRAAHVQALVAAADGDLTNAAGRERRSMDDSLSITDIEGEDVFSNRRSSLRGC